jgi:ferric enterobactin receptor
MSYYLRISKSYSIKQAMKIQNSLLALFLILSYSIQAQNAFYGKIKDDKNEAIFFATIALYNQADSTFIKSTTSDDKGNYTIIEIKGGNYYVEFSMLGFQKETKNLNFPADNGKSFDIDLLTDAAILSTVEVTAKLPLLEQRADRLIVNVENNLTSINSNLMDVMKKVPGMIVTGDKIRMAGQSNITILIDGRSTKYMDVQSLMKDIPGDNIKKIEVIHQPGAEFPAEGTGPIINIVLKKNSLFGTNGQLNAGVAKGENWRYNSSVSLSHYQGSMNVHGSAGIWKNAWYDRMQLTRIVAGDIYEQDSYDPGFSNGYRANLGLDWDIDSRHRVGFGTRYLNSTTDNLIENTTDVTFAEAGVPSWKLLTTNKQDKTWELKTINPYYQFEIDTLGQKLAFDVSYVNIENVGQNLLSSNEVNVGEPFYDQNNDQVGNTEFWTGQLDYTYPFSKKLKIQIGSKYTDATLDNDLINTEEQPDGSWKIDTTQSNHFIFDEEIIAAYAMATLDYGKWNGTIGLRYENSESQGYSVTLDSLIDRPISKMFPSASIGRKITDDLSASLAYSYRIDRPRYDNLNPFRYFLDQYTFEEGNPNLAPALTHSTKFNLAYQGQPFFNVEYKYTKDAMVEVTQQDDAEGTSSLTNVNLESFKVLNISLFFPLDFIPGITGYGGVIANRNAYDSDYLDARFVATKWDYTGFLQAEFKLPGKINGEVSGWYNSGGQDGLISAEWLYGVDIGFSKKFLNDKLSISLGCENILAKYMTANVKYANMDILIRDRWDGPIVNMRVGYRFGNQHMKQSKSHNSSSSDVINRAQQ